MKKFAILFSLFLLFTGCSLGAPNGEPQSALTPESTAPFLPENIDSLLEITNARRAAIIKPEPDPAQVENWNARETEPPVSISEIKFSFDPDISETSIYTFEQAQKDLDCLFYYYEIGYGPYFYFGGKDAFDAAKSAIEADLKAMTEITAPRFQESLVKHLLFVQDAHFAINQKSAVTYLEGYLSEQAFLWDTTGFIHRENGKRLLSVNGNAQYTENMVLSLTKEGDFIFRYMMYDKEQPAPVDFTYEGGEIQAAAMYSSHDASGKPAVSEEMVSLAYIDGIPVITIQTMGFPHAQEDWESKKLLELAKQLQDEPVLIVDLRNNGGGNGLLGQMFFEALTGAYITPNHYSLSRLVFGPEEPEPDPNSFYYIPSDVMAYYMKPELINDAWKLVNPEPRQIIVRDKLLIVLTNKNTASSADNFTDLSFNVENSLVIGSNTAGVMLSTASVGIKAPNTGIIGQMGFDLHVYDPSHFQEGIGFQPDLWTSGDALEAALALVKKVS